MNILDDFLINYRDNQIEFSKKDLLLFAVAALREAVRLELDNTGQPGKVAIEFLLNMKYEVVENRRLQIHAKDLLLAELDGVINKIAAKYHIKKQGNKFYFKESLAIVEPAIIGPAGSDLLADLYAANTELEVLRIQLARVNLNSSDCLRLRSAILDQENKIKAIKLAITKEKYFSHTDDLNSYNTMYRRSIGEAKDNSIRTGSLVGLAGGAIVGRQIGKNKYGYNKAEKQLNKADKFLDKVQSKAKKEYQNYVSAKNLTTANRKTLKRSGQTKKSASKLMADSKESFRKMMRSRAFAKNYKKQALKKLSQAGIKVVGSTIKGGVIGAAAGAGLVGAKKIYDRKNNQ